eukprot:scaffold3970_cov257-Pinguiococcus_pyrenoidosus.AAC.1
MAAVADPSAQRTALLEPSEEFMAASAGDAVATAPQQRGKDWDSGGGSDNAIRSCYGETALRVPDRDGPESRRHRFSPA